MFHFRLQCKTFGTWSGCQVSHDVFEGLRFPRSTFTTSETKKKKKKIWQCLGSVVIALDIVNLDIIFTQKSWIKAVYICMCTPVNVCTTSTIILSTIFSQQPLTMPHFPHIVETCNCYTMTPQQIQHCRLVFNFNFNLQHGAKECSDDDDARSSETHPADGCRSSEGLTCALWCSVCLPVCVSMNPNKVQMTVC